MVICLLICHETENVFILKSVLQNIFVVEIWGVKQYFGQSIANLTATWRWSQVRFYESTDQLLIMVVGGGV
jgi:hypothetical protein